MKDRNVQYPYRFHVRPVAGTDDICEIIPAPGTVYEDGTFWNKQNVLQDAVAALYGKDPSATPNEIFASIASKLQGQVPVFESGSYYGTTDGTTSGKVPKTIQFNYKPMVLFIQSNMPAGTRVDNGALYGWQRGCTYYAIGQLGKAPTDEAIAGLTVTNRDVIFGEKSVVVPYQFNISGCFMVYSAICIK